MLLRRYGNIEYILNMPFKRGLAMVEKAVEKTEEDRLFLQWCAWLPYMSEDRPQSFAMYLDRCTGRDIDTRPTAVILAELGISLDKEVSNGT